MTEPRALFSPIFVSVQFSLPRNHDWPDEPRRAIGSTTREIPNASWYVIIIDVGTGKTVFLRINSDTFQSSPSPLLRLLFPFINDDGS